MNCVPIGLNGLPDPNERFNMEMSVKWKNIEASAFTSILKFEYYDNGTKTWDTIHINPFILNFPAVTFTGGSTINIPCYSTNPVTIALNPYINTANNGIDKDIEITSHFEWTLPSGWQTTTGQTGTFVSSSSINVIPPASTTTVSISVRAKANTQYSSAATLQITRNLENFTISGPTSVYYNSTYRYTAPSITGVNYTWQLPAGWTGQSTGSYIDVVAGCSTGNISCTMTACNPSKTKTTTLPITSNVINPATTISGPSVVCSSGNTFTINNIPPVNSIVWTCGPSLTITSGQNTASCKFSATGSGSSWVRATLVTGCGSFVLTQKTVWTGNPAMPDFEIVEPVECNFLYEVVNSNYEPVTWSVTSPLRIVGPNTGYRCTFEATSSGYGRVRATASNACGTVYSEQEIYADCFDLLLAPNPATDEVEVSIKSESSDQLQSTVNPDQEFNIRIYNSMGNMVYNGKKAGDKAKVSTSAFRDGNYIVEVEFDKKVLKKQLIVKH